MCCSKIKQGKLAADTIPYTPGFSIEKFLLAERLRKSKSTAFY